MMMAGLEGLAAKRKVHHALEDALRRLCAAMDEEVVFRRGGPRCGKNLCTHDIIPNTGKTG